MMNRNYTLKQMTGAGFTMLLALFLFAACKKSDNYYYKYTNTTQEYNGTILDYVIQHPASYDSVLVVLDRLPNLKALLNSESDSSTFFAINNRSFELAIKSLNNTRALTKKKPIYLKDVDLLELDSIMSRYVIKGAYNTSDLNGLKEGLKVLSAQYDYEMHIQYNVTDASGFTGGGQQQLIFSDPNNSIFKRYWQSINTTAVNIRTHNGIIHVLASGHDFGFNKFTKKFAH